MSKHENPLKVEFLKKYQIYHGALGSICVEMKLNRNRFDYWYEEDLEFKSAIDTLDRSFVDVVEEIVWKKITQDKDSVWMWRYLQNKAPDRWKDAAVMSQLTGAAEITHKFELVDKVVGPKYVESKVTGTKPLPKPDKPDNNVPA
jgi:hypothetical protein